MNRKRNSIEKWIKKKNTLGNTYQTCFFGSPRGGAKLKKKTQKKEKRRESNRWSEMERKSLRMWRRRRVIFWSIRRVHVADNKTKKKKKRSPSIRVKENAINRLSVAPISLYCYLFLFFIFFIYFFFCVTSSSSVNGGQSMTDHWFLSIELISFDWIAGMEADWLHFVTIKTH